MKRLIFSTTLAFLLGTMFAPIPIPAQVRAERTKTKGKAVGIFQMVDGFTYETDGRVEITRYDGFGYGDGEIEIRAVMQGVTLNLRGRRVIHRMEFTFRGKVIK